MAAWQRGLSLRLRLMLLIGLIVAAVISIATYLETRLFERDLEREVREAAQSTATAVADDLELRADPLNAADVVRSLQEFVESGPALRAITVIALADNGIMVFASTSSQERPEALQLAETATAERRPVWADNLQPLLGVAVPIDRRGRPFGAAVVTVSLASVARLQTRGRLIGGAFVVFAIVVATLLIDLVARRFIHQPLSDIRATMQEAGAGELTARAVVARPDEIGAIVVGLNEMLDQMQHFNIALQERVREATEELRLRNQELVDGYQRILALREALARAEQMAAVGQMAANVAHQIGTPLNLISGYVQLLKEQAGSDLGIFRRLQIVEEQIAKVTTIVRTFLDRARLPSPREPVDLADLVDRVTDLARPKMQAAGILLDRAITRPLPSVLADVVQLELALLNVVANSLDAMPHGGVLSVSVVPLADGIRIEVSDTGFGIPATLLPQIFEPWVTTKPAGRGTGLGLSITREVVMSHGGSVSASNRPQGGALVRIDLPGVAKRLAEDGAAPDDLR